MRDWFCKGLVPFCIYAFLPLLFFSCQKENKPPVPGMPDLPPVPAALLKDIRVTNLPSPYYYFEYNGGGKVDSAIFSSGIRMYEIIYNADRISEIKNNTMVNHDRLQYLYDNSGRIELINYIDEGGTLYKKSSFTYDGQKLLTIKWERRSGLVFVTDREMDFVYLADGNVFSITDHRISPIPLTLISRFEQYDNKNNSDGFTLIHEENDHLLLLPAVQLQKNNPAKMIRTGDGLHYTIDYTYIYSDKNFPLNKAGDVTITNGPNAGQKFQSNTIYSYW